MTLSNREGFFNNPDLGDIKGGVAPFFNTLLTGFAQAAQQRRDLASRLLRCRPARF